jgi:hypothetical protein
MRAICIVVRFCFLSLGLAPLATAQTEVISRGKSGTGRIFWEIRLENNNYTLWLWPDGHKDQATQLGSTEDAMPVAVTFNGDDTWLVVTRHLSSGQLFSIYRKNAAGSYSEQGGQDDDDEPVPGFFKVEKTVADNDIDRWSVHFDNWDPSFGSSAFVFSWTARLNKGPDGNFRHFIGWQGVYDLEKRGVVKTLSPGKVFTQTELSEKSLNQDYRELRGMLDATAQQKLRQEQLEWLKKRDAVNTSQEKLELTMARVEELEDRIAKLKK